MSENKEAPASDTDPIAVFLGVVGIILPLAGLAFGGPGAWWQYLLWLVVGVSIVLGYMNSQSRGT